MIVLSQDDCSSVQLKEIEGPHLLTPTVPSEPRSDEEFPH